MYCAPSDIIATTCGQHVLPILPEKHSCTLPLTGKGQAIHGATKLMQDLQYSQCAWVPVTMPAYIAYGLLEQKSLLDKTGTNSKGSLTGKGQLAAQDQELHHQMLQKLALHLAAQPQPSDLARDAVPVTERSHMDEPAHQKTDESPVPRSVHPMGAQEKEKQPCIQRGQPGNEGRITKEAKSNCLPLQDQELQQEMLQKLALHLAAQEEASSESISGSRAFPESAGTGQLSPTEDEAIATPDVFPATPSSFCEEPCEHYYIGDEPNFEGAEETVSCSQCVWVPMHIAYGLIHGIAPGQDHTGYNGIKGVTGKGKCPNPLAPQDQDFHQQMLQKLALHLAAQPEPLEVRPTVEENIDHASSSRSKLAWADMVDEDSETPQPCIEVEEAMTSCSHRKDSKLKVKEATGKSFSLTSQQLKQSKPEQHDFQQEMLRKLALHLVAQPESVDQPQEMALASVAEAKAVGEDKARCDQLIAELELSADSERAPRTAQIVEMVLPGSRTLSLTPSGSRLVQKVIDVASVKQRELLLKELLQDVTDLYTSPHANHVVAKLIEIMPARNLASIGEAMRGKATTVARHQFGSRILERLIEHCDEDMISFLMDELLEDFEALARHQFGNFVVARLLEHGTAARKHSCLQKLLPYVLQHATHKTACNIVERMLDNADLACQAMIADAFLAGTGETSLEVIAATRYGSFVIQHLVNRFHPRIDAVKARVKAAHSQLQASGFSQRKIVQFLGDAFFRD